MKDEITRALIKYGLELRYEDIPEDVIREAKLRVLDSIGVALPAYFSEPVHVLRQILARLYCTSEYCTPFLLSDRCVPLDWAALASSLMVRYLDFNDTYLSKEPLHPSDMIGGLLIVASHVHASGKEFLTSVVLAYEIGCRLCDCGSLRLHGWDHVNYILVATTVAAGRLLGLDERRLAEALAIACVSHASMRQTRVGELSHWKAVATADAVRHAVYACMLARHGMTGPDKPFTGEMAFIRQLLSGEFDPKPILELENMPKPAKAKQTIIKHFPVEIHSQTAVEAAQEIRARLGPLRAEDIDEIEIGTFKTGYDIIVKDPEKWDPKTKETADHSLPWITATALLYGEVWLEHYEPERIRDPAVLSLLKRTRVYVDPDIDRLYPEAIPNKVRVRLRDGREECVRVDYPKGHPRNPMTVEDVRQKFVRLTKPYLTRDRIEKIVQEVLRLEDIEDVSTLLKTLAL